MARPADPAAWMLADGPSVPSSVAGIDVEVADHAGRFLTGPEDARDVVSDLTPEGTIPIKLTASVCPDCLGEGRYDDMAVPMVVFEAPTAGEIRLRKRCALHGEQTDVAWTDAGLYRRAKRWGERSRHPALPTDDHGGSARNGACCSTPTSATEDAGCCTGRDVSGIGNIAVTNRCDRSCHYCFFYADSGEPLYEPSKTAIRSMAETLAADGGIGAIQLTGGEPTVREDIVELVDIASEYAEQVLLNSHAARFMHEPELAAAISDAGARGLYTSFDGVTPRHNPKSFWEFPHGLAATHDAGMCAMLVPTVIDGWNDTQLGDIVRFGAANAATVCGVNFQPVSFVGRMDPDRRRERRITIPGIIERVEAQTDGAIPAEAWYPLPVYKAISAFLEDWTGEDLYGVTSDFSSWMVSAVFVDGDELVPITDVIDVGGFLEAIRDLLDDYGRDPGGLDKLRAGRRLLETLGDLTGPHADANAPGLRELARDTLRGEFDGLSGLYDELLPLGIRHFQDPYNYDVDRLADSDVHYAMPDGRVVPFSVYNTFPECYRDRIKREHSIEVDAWLDRDYAELEAADDDRRSVRSDDVLDPEGGSGVFGADLTYSREFGPDTKGTVRTAYRRSIEALEPVWSAVGP